MERWSSRRAIQGINRRRVGDLRPQGRVNYVSRPRVNRVSADSATQLVQVRPDTWVANLVAQRGIRTGSSGPPIRYDAVERCLRALAEHAVRLSATVHMPRIGCGLAGGRRERIEPLVTATLCGRDIDTTVYDHD
jgi:O-acetyl-ADP-ribose deacetylase (regulator of RNase III)